MSILTNPLFPVDTRVVLPVALERGLPDLTGTVVSIWERPWGDEYEVRLDPGQWYKGTSARVTPGAMILRKAD